MPYIKSRAVPRHERVRRKMTQLNNRNEETTCRIKRKQRDSRRVRPCLCRATSTIRHANNGSTAIPDGIDKTNVDESTRDINCLESGLWVDTMQYLNDIFEPYSAGERVAMVYDWLSIIAVPAVQLHAPAPLAEVVDIPKRQRERARGNPGKRLFL